MKTISITNEQIFNNSVIDVDTDGLTRDGNIYRGTISIETSDGWKDFTGEHSPNDYEADYGFLITKSKELHN